MTAASAAGYFGLRSAAMAWQAASIFFVLTVGAFYFLCTAVLGATPYLWMLPAAVAAFWIAKYGYAILGAAVDGNIRAPVPSIEILGPFDGPGPLAQLMLGVAIHQAASRVGGVTGELLLGAAIALLPASIGVLGATHHVLDSMNPVILWRLVRGLGRQYLVMLAAAAVGVALVRLLSQLELPMVLQCILFALILLSFFGLIGGVMYERRVELGLEPRSSPERRSAQTEALRIRQRQHMLDEVYGPMRARDYALAVAPLRMFLGAAEPSERALDVPAIMGQVQQWNDKRGLATVTRCVVALLLEKGELSLALGVADDTCRQLPAFAFDSEPACLALARYARSVGRAGLGLLLIERFAAVEPARTLGPEVLALRAELQR